MIFFLILHINFIFFIKTRTPQYSNKKFIAIILRCFTHCFSLRSKGVREGFLWREVVFLIKIFNFYQKKQLPSDRFFLKILSLSDLPKAHCPRFYCLLSNYPDSSTVLLLVCGRRKGWATYRVHKGT